MARRWTWVVAAMIIVVIVGILLLAESNWPGPPDTTVLDRNNAPPPERGNAPPVLPLEKSPDLETGLVPDISPAPIEEQHARPAEIKVRFFAKVKAINWLRGKAGRGYPISPKPRYDVVTAVEWADAEGSPLRSGGEAAFAVDGLRELFGESRSRVVGKDYLFEATWHFGDTERGDAAGRFADLVATATSRHDLQRILIKQAEREGRGLFASSATFVAYQDFWELWKTSTGWLSMVRKGAARVSARAGVLNMHSLGADGDWFLAVGDLTGDGGEELVFNKGDRLYVYGIADGAGVLIAKTPPDPDLLRVGKERVSRSASIGDLDGDGDADLVYAWSRDKREEDANETGAVVVLSYDRERSTFERVSRLKLLDDHGYTSYGTPVFGDFNGDGKTEALVANSNGYFWVLAPSEGGCAVVNTFSVHEGGACTAYAADLNGDGRTEIVEGTNGGDVSVRTLSADYRPCTLWSDNIGRLAHDLCFADFNGDGIKDIVAEHSYTDDYDDRQVSVLASTGNNSWSTAWFKETGKKRASIYVGDVTANGTPELIMVTANRETEVFCVKKPDPAALWFGSPDALPNDTEDEENVF